MSMPAERSARLKPLLVAGAATLVVALIALAVILAEPFKATAYDLDEHSVWIVSDLHAGAGHLNNQIAELDGKVDRSPTQDVLQDGRDVFLFDESSKELRRVDPETLTVSDPASLQGTPEVLVSGGRVAVLDKASGDVWTGPTDAGADLAGGDPAFNAGPDALLAMGPDGSVAALGSDGALHVVHPDGGEPQRSSRPGVDGLDGFQLAFAGSVPVVLDAGRAQLLVGEEAPIGLGAAGDDPQLQLVGDDGTAALVAGADALVRVPLDGSPSEALWDGGTGSPVRPVRAAGCNFGAWRQEPTEAVVCDGEAPVTAGLQGLRGSILPDAEMRFRVNRGAVALNEQVNGIGFVALGGEIRAVDNWDALEDEQEEQVNDDPPEEELPPPEQENRPPVPKDDLDLGARPGRPTILPVLDNDYDPDQDVLLVSRLENAEGLDVEIVQGGRALQLDATDEASGTIEFSYVVSDGKPGGEATAKVKVQYKGVGENTPPKLLQRRPPWKVEAEQRIGDDALKGWRDAEGDPMFLKQAETGPPNSVQFDPSGHVDFIAGPVAGNANIGLQVSDGLPDGEGSDQLAVEIFAVGTPLPPIARNDFAEAFVGEPVTIDVLANDSDPNGDQLVIKAIEPVLQRGATAKPDDVAGAVVFQGSEVGPAVFRYTIEDPDGSTSNGWVRVEVRSRREDKPPVAVFDVAAVPLGGEVVVDLLANDYDPDGDVIAVTGVTPSDQATAAGVTTVLDQLRYLHVYVPGKLDDSGVVFGYSISDGKHVAEGSVRVISLPPPAVNRVPVTAQDRATVRAGDVVTIPVLANDTDPDGDALTLLPELPAPPKTGEAFVDQDTVRYQAGPDAGTVEIGYTIEDAIENRAPGSIVVVVVAADAPNLPPRPLDLEARTLVGEPVVIPVPLDGIDPDGDSVTLEGSDPSLQPTYGTVVLDREPGRLLYTPPDTAVKSDEFAYRVRDRRGAVGTAHVRVTIAPPVSEDNNAPVAVPDRIEVRPGADFYFPVLANDVDIDNDDIVFARPSKDLPEPIKAPPELTVSVPDGEDRLLVKAPGSPGSWSILYVITDGKGLVGAGSATVIVREDATGTPPVARDDVVEPTEDDAARVEVLENDEDPDGLVDQLTVSVVAGIEGVSVDGSTVVATLTDRARIVRYTVTDVDDNPASAFIWLPPRGGTANRAPQQRASIDRVEVTVGQSIELPIEEYVWDPDGDDLVLGGPELISATKNDPSKDLFLDETTVLFTAGSVHGAGQVTFEVADRPLDDPARLTAVVTVPVRVNPEANEPPDFKPTSLSVLVGNTTRQPLLELVTDEAEDRLRFTGATIDDQAGLRVSIDGNVLEIEWIDDGARAGQERQVTVTVEDDGVDGGWQGEMPLPLAILETKAPPPTARPDPESETTPADRGAETSHDVTKNDIDPFGRGLTVIEAKLVSGAGIVDKSGGVVSFDPAEGFLETATIEYTIEDETGEVDHRSTSIVKFAARDIPGKPLPPTVKGVGDEQVTLSWSTPDRPGNAGPLRYTVEFRPQSGGSWQQAQCPNPQANTCVVDGGSGIRNGTTYVFRVTAENEVAPGPPSDESGPGKPDVKPEAPRLDDPNRPGENQLKLTWTAGENRGSEVTGYIVKMVETAQMGGGGASVPWRTASCVEGTDDSKGGTCTIAATPGEEYAFTVVAVNDEGTSDPSNEVRGIPLGKPQPPAFTPGSPSVDAQGRTVSVSWLALPATAGPDAKVCVWVEGVERQCLGRDTTSLTMTDLAVPETFAIDLIARNEFDSSGKATGQASTYTAPDAPVLSDEKSLIDSIAWVESPLVCSNNGDCSHGEDAPQRTIYAAEPGKAPFTFTSVANLLPWVNYEFTIEDCNGALCTWSNTITAQKVEKPVVTVTLFAPEAGLDTPACLDDDSCVAFTVRWTGTNPAADYASVSCPGTSNSVNTPRATGSCTTQAPGLAAVSVVTVMLDQNPRWATLEVEVCDATTPEDDAGTELCGSGFLAVKLR